MAASDKSREIGITRVYDADVKAVWDAWTDPEQVVKWWGPRGFTLTTHARDLRPGGVWHYTMHGPDCTDYPNKTLYHEVVPYQKLVYDHGGNDDRPPLFRVTALFSETNGKTTLKMTMTLATAEKAKETARFIKAAGGNATWDRLAEFLDERKSGAQGFVINRSFAAPVARVFEMWSRPEHFARWLAPSGFEMEVLSGEIRAGGQLFFRMFNPEGVNFYARFDYRQVDVSEGIVYVQQFCDAEGRPSRHPGMQTFPERLLNKVTFADEEEGATRVTVVSIPVAGATAEEIQAFVGERPGMTLGWTGSFDKLEANLA